MVNLDAVRSTLTKGLRDYLGIPVIKSNQTSEPPLYPYCSYTITTLASANNGTWGKYDDGVSRIPFTQTWSITIMSDNASESMDLAIKAREWLNYAGRMYLNDNGVIVQKTLDITNRDNLLTVEYEYRNGFDCVISVMSEITDDNKEVIEVVEFPNTGIVVEPNMDELIEKLAMRLTGR